MIVLAALAISVGQCTTPRRASDFTVVVDAGHGGRDVGASAIIPGKYEKQVTLAIAAALSKKLALRKGLSVVMTRATDRNLTLGQRRQIIGSCTPDLVISVHADSGPSSASGPSVYVLNDAGEAIVVSRLMRSARSVDHDDDTAFILANLSQRGSMNFAVQLAVKIRAALGRGDANPRAIKTANFALLKAPGVPSILVETGYVTSRIDATRLFDTNHQALIADAIASSIRPERR
ncbi:N-acetylmuramoyl-L-alanine amidase [Sphingomonas sp. LB3N6]|uniref:N-acetylmuramoyl-L-alanine amidase family protein n=1 Tax=Sphingomonas fucosidasi TaxID=3096164 RepID=UPI002FC75DCD